MIGRGGRGRRMKPMSVHRQMALRIHTLEPYCWEEICEAAGPCYKRCSDFRAQVLSLCHFLYVVRECLPYINNYAVIIFFRLYNVAKYLCR